MSAAFIAASPASSAAAAAASASRGRRTSRRINRSGAAVKWAHNGGGTTTTTSRRAAAAPAAAAAATTTAASASAGCRASRVTTRTRNRRVADVACAATDQDITFLLDAEGSTEPASQADYDKLWQWLATNGQGLTLVHFSAQLERFVWDRGCA
jgi:hypothetical protein